MTDSLSAGRGWGWVRSELNGQQAGGMTPCKQRTLGKTSARGLIWYRGRKEERDGGGVRLGGSVWSRRGKYNKRRLAGKLPSFVLPLPAGEIMANWRQPARCNTWTSITWFVGKGEDCFWAAHSSLHTALSSSQALLMLPVFRIPGAAAAVGREPGDWSCQGLACDASLLSPPSLAHPQFPWLPPSPPPHHRRRLNPIRPRHGSPDRCFDKCFRHNVKGNPPACQKC